MAKTQRAATVAEYFLRLPEGQKPAMEKLRAVINKNIPVGFVETINYGMPSWAVPHSLYPAGYHCDPKLPLGFLSIAAQKNFIALYHMGIYADKKLLAWFTAAYIAATGKNPDMGKSCVRFRKPGEIPFELIGGLAKKTTPAEWIKLYEKSFLKK